MRLSVTAICTIQQGWRDSTYVEDGKIDLPDSASELEKAVGLEMLRILLWDKVLKRAGGGDSDASRRYAITDGSVGDSPPARYRA